MPFDAEAGSGGFVQLDASEPDGGQNMGFRPMELLLVGLAGCTAMDVISILRKKREDVKAYEVQVHALRAEDHPMIFTRITVRHILTGHRIDPTAAPAPCLARRPGSRMRTASMRPSRRRTIWS